MKKLILFVKFCGFVLSALFMSCEPATNKKDEPVPTLSSITINQKPAKLSYYFEETLDLTGLVVEAKYSDDSEKTVEGWTSDPKPWTKLTTKGKITVTISYEGKSASFSISVTEKPVITSNEYFWGTWVRMDNGKEYEVLETSVVQDNNNYKVIASDSTTLEVNSLGKFTKESDSVIVCNKIPYFRKGGANLEYSLKLVGFTTNGRAAGTPMSGIKGKAKSLKYSKFEINSESDVDGNIKFTAPTVNDSQTVEISNGNDLVVIPGLKVNNSGDYMGTVALVGKNDYNLKITGTISDDQKDNGYLFGNNAKTYNMLLTITNISENKCSTSGCKIESDDSNLVLNSETNLKGFTISTLAGGATKTISLSLSYGDLATPYVDTGIIVTIKNPKQEWKDYIPLRFFKGTIPITIAAKNPENNSNAALNGFIIYPDGNNQFFTISHNSCKPIFVPTFGKEKPYMLVFSGATVTSQLDDSTEMYYTVEPATLSPRTVVTDGDLDTIVDYISFGGENHSETAAYNVTKGFEAYLSDGEIDYYKITADSDTYYGPGGSVCYYVSYMNEKGAEPDAFFATKGAILSTIQLPEMTCDGYKFLGWYIGNTKIAPDSYTVNGNIILTAKWLKNCTVNYVTAHSTAPVAIIVCEGEKLTVEQLPELTSCDYFFDGWYVGETRVTTEKYMVADDVTLTAKWVDKCTISYVTDHGIVPQAIDVKSGSVLTTDNLPKLKETGWKFKGWYTDSSYDEDKKAKVGHIVTTSFTLYAKWDEYTGPDDDFIFVEGGTFSMGSILGDSDEKPVHNVTLNSFYICDHELTQGEYVAVMGTNPSSFKSNPANREAQENRPVEYVSWYDAIYFCNKYSESVGLTPCYKVNGNTNVTRWNYTPHNGKSISGTIICDMKVNGYRLPTEAEWEYAAKGGNQSNGYTYSGSNSIDSVAWYTNNSSSKTHEVKKKVANELELFDMSGNVYEWCWDWYTSSYSSDSVTDPCGASTGTYRVIRGGCWCYDATTCRSADRTNGYPYCNGNGLGFRLVRSAQ